MFLMRLHERSRFERFESVYFLPPARSARCAQVTAYGLRRRWLTRSATMHDSAARIPSMLSLSTTVRASYQRTRMTVRATVDPHFRYRMDGSERPIGKTRASNLFGAQLVGSLAAAHIDLRGGSVDRDAMVVEREQRSGFVIHEVGLQALEGLVSHEKSGLHGRIVTPEPHRAACRIAAPAVVGKTQRHG